MKPNPVPYRHLAILGIDKMEPFIMWDKSKYLEPKLTNLSEKDLVESMRNAWNSIFKKFPSTETLAIITAQIMLETGRLKSMYNYNLGNVKSKPNDGHYWTMYKCSEILNGKEVFFEPPHDQCKFKAHKSMEEAILFHINFLKDGRYKKALSFAIEGDVVKYTTELKTAGYFTASLSIYLNAMKKLYKEYVEKISHFEFVPPKSQAEQNEVDSLGVPELSSDDSLVDNPVLPDPVKASISYGEVEIKEKETTLSLVKKVPPVTIITIIMTIVTFLIAVTKC